MSRILRSWISAGYCDGCYDSYCDGCYDSHYDSYCDDRYRITARAVAAMAAATAATTQPRRFDGMVIQATCMWEIRFLRQVSAVCHPKTWPLSSKENSIPMRKRGRPKGLKDKELRKRGQKATGGGDTTELATKKASMPTVQASKASKALISHLWLYTHFNHRKESSEAPSACGLACPRMYSRVWVDSDGKFHLVLAGWELYARL
jgi:hypothetical protein